MEDLSLADQNDGIGATLWKRKEELGDAIEHVYVEEPPLIDLYDDRCVLGRRIFGTTYCMINSDNNYKYAVKRVRIKDALANGVSESMLLRECNYLLKVTHPNIARYYIHFISKEKRFFNIVMELIEGGTIVSRITCVPAPNQTEILKWAKQMATALRYMHEKRVFHRDLKPENVMLTAGGNIKIIDLGLACIVSSAKYMASKVGTHTYSSYEKREGIAYDGRDDVWAVGCILLELITRTRWGSFQT
jgi:serine/threonine protein kinase